MPLLPLRRRPVPPLLLVFLLLLVVAAVRPPAADPTTIVLVRHAEKAAVPGPDPPLSAEGEARSLALLDVLRDGGVTAIVTTQLRRTQQTAAPLARERGLRPEVVEVDPDVARHARRIAEWVLTQHPGETVLVVGHSNTIPAIVEALGAGRVPPIRDGEYDHLFVVQKPAAGSVRLIRARFGAPSLVAAGEGIR